MGPIINLSDFRNGRLGHLPHATISALHLTGPDHTRTRDHCHLAGRAHGAGTKAAGSLPGVGASGNGRSLNLRKSLPYYTIPYHAIPYYTIQILYHTTFHYTIQQRTILQFSDLLFRRQILSLRSPARPS